MSFSKENFGEIPLEPGMDMSLSVCSSMESGKLGKVSPNGYTFFLGFPYAFWMLFIQGIQKTCKQRQTPQIPLPNEGGRQAGRNQ